MIQLIIRIYGINFFIPTIPKRVGKITRNGDESEMLRLLVIRGVDNGVGQLWPVMPFATDAQ